jgi:hypothetical protein
MMPIVVDAPTSEGRLARIDCLIQILKEMPLPRLAMTVTAFASPIGSRKVRIGEIVGLAMRSFPEPRAI